MLHDSASEMAASTWESMASWFTPTVLFLLLNLTIATIALTSALASHGPGSDGAAKNVPRSGPSSVLHRLKSAKFYAQHHKQSPDSDPFHGIESHTEYLFQHTSAHESIEADPQIRARYGYGSTRLSEPEGFQSPLVPAGGIDDADSDSPARAPEESNPEPDDSIGVRSEEETEHAIVPVKLPAKMLRSVSLRAEFKHSEEVAAVEERRPATVREKGSAKATDEGDEEVDAKANIFINKFKHQLKLQRLDSILRSGADM